MIQIFGIPFLKKGSGIHIKKKNRGKFTAAAKRAGKSVQQYARDILADPSATPLLKKRANFARNSARWSKKQEGGMLIKRSELEGLTKDSQYKNNFDLKLNLDNLAIANDSLVNRGANRALRAAVLSNIISENGGDIGPHGNGAFGLVGWRGKGALGLPKDLPGQLHKLMVETFEEPKDWHHGGPGMNISSAKEMFEFWKSGAMGNIRKATNAFTRGYVRPPEDLYGERINLAKIIYKYLE